MIYAPRKSVCDVYATRHGPLLHTLQCGANCRSAAVMYIKCRSPTSCCWSPQREPSGRICRPVAWRLIVVSILCRLLQPSPPLGPATGAGATSDCLLLDFDTGAVTSVRRLLGGSG